MHHRTATLRALAPLLLALAACDPSVVGNGIFDEETRDLAAFTGVTVSDGLPVVVTSGAAGQVVRLSGDENVLAHVLTEVVNDAALGKTLLVRADVGRIESTHPLRVTVAAEVIDHLRAGDGATLTVTGAAAGRFHVRGEDGAAITLSGAGGDLLTLALSGGAVLEARSYVVDEAEVQLSEAAVASVHVDERITGTVTGGSTLVNYGEGACEVTRGAQATVTCGD